MKLNHKFCSICEILGEDVFSAGPPKNLYFLCKSFQYVETICIEPHDTYVLFRTFLFQSNNKRFFSMWGPPEASQMASLLAKGPMSFLASEDRPGIGNIAMISVRTTILNKKIGVGPTCSHICNFIIHPIKNTVR